MFRSTLLAGAAAPWLLLSASAAAQTGQPFDQDADASSSSELSKAAGPKAAPAADRPVTAGGDEIVVTALKRPQQAMDVPASISTLSEDLLRRLNASDFSRVADSVPGLGYAAVALGSSQYTIRGIGQVGQVQAPTTGVYLDETPLQTRTTRAATQPDPQLFDVARIEVLRGPQGVLYGSSSMGGLVRIVTNQPDASAVSGRAEASVGTVAHGGTSWDVKGMVNFPLVADTLALRVSGSLVRQGGWIDDLRPTTGDITANRGTDAVRKDDNWSRIGTVRAALRWDASPTLTITPSIVWQDAYGNTDRSNSDVDFGLRGRTRARYQDSFTKDRFTIGSLLVEKDVDALGGVRLVSSSSYLDRRTRVFVDVTAFDSPIVEAIVGPGPGGRLFPTPLQDFSRTRQFTQEVRAVSSGSGPVQYVLGGVYRDLDQRSGRLVTVADLLGTTPPPPLGTGSPPVIEDRAGRFDETEIAAFGEVTYAVMPAVKIAAGARVFRYRQQESGRRYGVGGVAGGTLDYDYVERNRESGITPRLTISYQPSRAATLYASFSQGFRTGGVNAPITDGICSPAERQAAGLPDVPPPYDGDKTDNYELGARTSLLGGRLQISGAAYAIEWKDYQQSFQTSCGLNNATQVAFIVNAGRVRSRGGELEVGASPIAGLELQAGGAFTDATYRKDVPNLLLPAGSRVLDMPRWTWNARAAYDFAVRPDLDASLFLAARHVGASNSGFGEGEVLPRPAYTLVDASAGVRLRGGPAVNLFATNLFDAVPVYAQEFAASPGNTTATNYFAYLVGPPRTVGVRVSKAF